MMYFENTADCINEYIAKHCLIRFLHTKSALLFHMHMIYDKGTLVELYKY